MASRVPARGGPARRACVEGSDPRAVARDPSHRQRGFGINTGDSAARPNIMDGLLPNADVPAELQDCDG